MKYLVIVMIMSLLTITATAQSHDPTTNNCWFTADQNTIGYQDETLTTQHQAIPTINAGDAFPVTDMSGIATLLLVDHAMGFWVDAAMGTFTGDCSDFADIMTQSHNPVTSTCWFTANQDIIGFQDETLTEQHPAVPTMRAGDSFQVTDMSGSAALLAVDHAMGFWVDTRNGTFSGDCSNINVYQPENVRVLANTRLWSQPDVVSGSVIRNIAQGTTVTIIGGTVIGRIRYGSTVTGTWYPVTIDNQTGWVWAARLDFESSPMLITDAIALENARLWSQPDVVSGSVIADIPINTSMDIIGGPTVGMIQYNGLTGVWYQVEVNSQIGWVWERRIDLLSSS